MAIEKRSIDKDVKKVLKQLMVSIDFDVETLFESHPEEVKDMVLDAVLMSINEKDIPNVEWISFVDEEEVEKFKTDTGTFIHN